MKVTQEQLEETYDPDLVDYISKNAGSVTRYRPPGFGVTAAEYAEITGTAVDVARRALKKMVDKGMLKSERMITPGKTGTNAYVYYKPEEKEGDE